MKSTLPFFLIIILLYSCNEKTITENTPAEKSSAPVSEDQRADTSKSIYSDDGDASFLITAVDSNNGYQFKSRETSYKVAFIALNDFKDLQHYIAKYTTDTKSCTGCEVQDRTITVELRPFEHPNETARTIQQACDELTLDVHNYKTTKYGCCGAEDELAIYDYDNKRIVQGDNKIIHGDIPNSQISFYVAYKPEYKDSTILGVLYYSYSSSDSYAITIKSKPLPEDSCSPFSPEITMISTNPDDTFEEVTNEYTFWSLDDIKTNSQVNHLTVKIMYDCDSQLHFKPIDIPIIDGKPFGKEERNQTIEYRKQ